MVLRITLKSRSHLTPAQKHSRNWLKQASLLVLLLGSWIGYKQIESHFTEPEAVLVLGGSPSREVFAAEFAKQHPNLDIWVSGGSNREYSEWVFTEAGIDLNRVHLDYQAVDTVTNFTTLADSFKAQGIDSVYLITSENHMRRAWVIGSIVLGSRDIEFKPVVVPSAAQPEPIKKSIRDGVRALLWVTTGETGAQYHQ